MLRDALLNPLLGDNELVDSSFLEWEAEVVVELEGSLILVYMFLLPYSLVPSLTLPGFWYITLFGV